MERNKDRKFAPGMWAAIGGHVEPNEMNSPEIACLREIKEETGLESSQLIDFQMKYVLISKSANEIITQYVFTCKTDQREITTSDEGTMQWIHESQLFDRKLTYITAQTLEHYLKHRNSLNKIVVGVIDKIDVEPQIHWNFV
jgi:8-oxo-dGTP diphosphatase